MNSKNNYSDFNAVFWMNMPSIHMAFLMKSLARLPGVRVLVVVPNDVYQAEKERGWATVDYGNAVLKVVEKEHDRDEIVEQTRNALVHTFAGIGVYPAVTRAMNLLTAGHHGRICVFSESWDPRGWKSNLRYLRFMRRRRLLKRVDTIFVTSALARQQYISLGFPGTQIALFGYFVEAGENQSVISKSSNSLRVIYVGSLIRRKDPLTLLRAMSQLSFPWELTVLGSGPLLKKMKKISKKNDGLGSTTYISTLENSETRSLISTFDVLVLPSLYDGWGATVTEALMVGTRVAVSNSSGASMLIHSQLQGEVFKTGNTMELRNVLTHAYDERFIHTAQRGSLIRWAEQVISPRTAAIFFWEQATRPYGSEVDLPPWSPSYK